MARAFLDALRERVLVCDGAMGTVLYGRGVFLNRCFDELNLTHAGLVTEVHEEYVRAGADVIETNTFGANRVKLGTFGLSAEVHAINLAGAALRKSEASGAEDRRRYEADKARHVAGLKRVRDESPSDACTQSDPSG